MRLNSDQMASRSAVRPALHELSIQQKALDGAEVQTPSFYATRLWEVTKYINKTEHFQLIGSVVTGTKFRDSLSEEGGYRRSHLRRSQE